MVIFDLDGTLWDSTVPIAESWNIVIEKETGRKGWLTGADIEPVQGKTMDEIADIIFCDFPEEERYPLARKCEVFENEYIEKTGATLFEGVEETLAKLKDMGVKMAVVSNCQEGYIKAFLDSMDMWKYFVDYEEWGRTMLLKADNIKLVMERNGASKGIYVGDIQKDSDAAHKAGIDCIYASYGFGEINDAVATLKSFDELPGILEELGFLPADAKNIRRLLDYNNGLILVTGPLGSGKTTTLASMIEVANNTREDHVITVEDPIEIVQKSKGCQITQREIGTCTKSYHAALKGALREDPDIIVIGEMHDLETIENAITASETGHLVIGTLHTCDAGNTLNRVLDVFPPAQQPQIRAMTAGSLRGIVCQRLVPAANGGLTIAYELLINTVAVANLISEGKLYQLKATMQIGSKAGMCTLDQNLFEKFKAGHITADTALAYMRDTSVIDQIKKYVAVEEAKKLVAAKAAAKKKK